MSRGPRTVAGLLGQVWGGYRPGLGVALAEYAYVLDHVAGGSTTHAAAIMARIEVVGAIPTDAGVRVDDLIDAYLDERARRHRESATGREREEREARLVAERARLDLWDRHLADLRRGVALTLPDGTPLTIDQAAHQRWLTEEAIASIVGEV